MELSAVKVATQIRLYFKNIFLAAAGVTHAEDCRV